MLPTIQLSQSVGSDEESTGPPLRRPSFFALAEDEKEGGLEHSFVPSIQDPVIVQPDAMRALFPFFFGFWFLTLLLL